LTRTQLVNPWLASALVPPLMALKRFRRSYCFLQIVMSYAAVVHIFVGVVPLFFVVVLLFVVVLYSVVLF